MNLNNNSLNLRFNKILKNKIYNVITELNNKINSGKDEITKIAKHIINDPPSAIINQSLVTVIFPSVFEIMKVISLYKKGDKQYLSNNKQISLLPTISKVFERVLYTPISNRYNRNSLLSEE